jgi:hypothetical protein
MNQWFFGEIHLHAQLANILNLHQQPHILGHMYLLMVPKLDCKSDGMGSTSHSSPSQSSSEILEVPSSFVNIYRVKFTKKGVPFY